MMPKSLISYFEVGHGYPSAESLEILADHFGVTMDYLWKGTKQKGG